MFDRKAYVARSITYSSVIMLESENGQFIGKAHEYRKVDDYTLPFPIYFPEMTASELEGVFFQINHKSYQESSEVKSGDDLRIKTLEKSAWLEKYPEREYLYLLPSAKRVVYYLLNEPHMLWTIVKEGGTEGEVIKDGDKVSLVHNYKREEECYLKQTVDHTGKLLTVESNPRTKPTWIIHLCVRFNITKPIIKKRFRCGLTRRMHKSKS